MSLSAVLHDLPDRPDLRAQTEQGCPPQVLTIEGVQRTRRRGLTPAGAIAQAERGRPASPLTFGKCADLSPAVLAAVLVDENFHVGVDCGEADIHMYGQHRAGEPDTRLVVVTVAQRVE